MRFHFIIQHASTTASTNLFANWYLAVLRRESGEIVETGEILERFLHGAFGYV
jgi:hypothetical protein